MALNRLLLFIAFLLHIGLSRMSPARLICDRRLIQKYITEATDMEEQTGQDGSQQPDGASQVAPERNPRRLFQTYAQLVRGKLRFLFQDLWRDWCAGDAPGAA